MAWLSKKSIVNSRTVWASLTRQGCAAVTALSLLGTGVARAASVDDYLASGEFGPALDAASKLAAGDDQATAFTKISAAQAAAGGTHDSRGSVTRVPGIASRVAARRERAASTSQGGAQADFSELMALIQANTSGSWEEEDGAGGSMSPFNTGVKVNPNGLLERISNVETGNRLAGVRDQARQAALNQNLQEQSELRFVSLTKLEREVSRRLAEGKTVPDSMQQLAGLTNIQYVLVIPETKEVVVAGQAGGWKRNGAGQAVSAVTERPTYQLDDLVTVLRVFMSGQSDFGCSINTRDANVAALKQFAEASQAKGPLSAGSVKNWVNQLQKHLGRQDIVVWGVPAESRVAKVIIEADYRMKLVGIDKLEAGKNIPSYFDLLPKDDQKNPPALDALRWWLTLKCDAITRNNSRDAFELAGSSVLCQSENQLLTAEGQHVPTGQAEETNRQFAERFTKHYGELASRDLVFADCANIFDLSLVAAIIANEKLDARTQPLTSFAPKGIYSPVRYSPATEVESVVNHRVYGGKNIVVQVAGGVRPDPLALVTGSQPAAEDSSLTKLTEVAKPEANANNRWWWDAK
jgi:Protein of unknown function (DUF1598)